MFAGLPACSIRHLTRPRFNPTFQCQYRSLPQAKAWIPGERYSIRNHRRLAVIAGCFKDHSYFLKSKRRFSASSSNSHGHLTPPKPGEELHVTFIDKEGDEHVFEVAKGDNLLDIAQSEELEMEGACGGSCACSTCHIIVESQDKYDAMPQPDDDENDMLDLAFGLTETSRLGCQVKMTPELDGMKVRLPSMTRNLQKSDFEGGKKA